MSAPTPEHRKPVRLAMQALHHAVAQDWPKATRVVARLNAECGEDGLGDALVTWCEAFVQHAHGGAREFAPINMVRLNTDTGRLNEPVPPRVEWATDMIQARAQGDLDRFQAKLAQLNSIKDGYERGRWVSALIESVALSMRSFPRGYATMGRGSADG